MKTPIIFIHKGNPIYLQVALLQAKKTCTDEVFLLGDETNNFNYIKHFNISDYDKTNELKSIYIHMSPNKYDYELFCIQRWFIIRDFCLKNRIEQFWVVDSDVLIYEDLQKALPYLSNKDFSVIAKKGFFVGPQTSYFKTEVLEDFCNFIISCYKTKTKLQTVYQKLQDEKNISGISDMVLLELYCDHNKKYIDFDYSKDRNFLFDENINCPHGFEFKNGKKNIKFKSNIPYARLNSEKHENLEFATLHFQGGAKELMLKYSTLNLFNKKNIIGYKIYFKKNIFSKIKKNYKTLIPCFIKNIIKNKINRRKILKENKLTIFPLDNKINKNKYLYQLSFFAEFKQYFNLKYFYTNIKHDEILIDISMASFLINQDYESYFSKTIRSSERALIRKATKNGFSCKRINYDEYLNEIYEINISKTERQNEKMSDDYLNLKPREKIVTNIGQSVYTYGCFSPDNKLVAYYMFESYGKNIIHTVKGIGHNNFLSFGIMNMLFAYSVSELYKIYPDKTHFILYGGMNLTGDGLSRFKRNVGCNQVFIKIKANKSFFYDLDKFNLEYKIHGDTGLNFVLDYM